MLGKEIRSNRLKNKKSGRMLGVMIDHPICHGVLPGIEDIDKRLKQIVEGRPDVITMHKGIAMKCYSKFADSGIPFLLKCSSFSPYQKNYDVMVSDVEEAIQLGADGVSVGVILGGDRQPEMLHNLGLISKQAQIYGMPLVAHIYPRGEYIKNELTVKNVSYAVRVAAELGVDIAKIHYTGTKETFRPVIASTPCKVVIAGGKVGNEIKDLFQMTRDAIDVGAFGIAYGRAVWQYQDPAKMIKALKLIIHEDASVKEAMKYLNLK
ncbi:MAG TPA: fructose-bisphosphate aldolase [Candidatus Atribacteria bacterium]|nr:MAG: fructose-bisphosphate aldolase [Candidatus Nealsonbacteria bacterium]HDK26690.1 fructose-bisphosphate aldolase [Candidatus Atribacteria bacterium]